MIMIGHRFRLFHQRTLKEHPRIPLLNVFPAVAEKLKDKDNHFQYRHAQNELKAWNEAGISAAEIHARNRAGWAPIFELYKEDENVPFDVLNTSHRPRIEEALGWVQRLASTRGKAIDENGDV
jgi:hypothetical protein